MPKQHNGRLNQTRPVSEERKKRTLDLYAQIDRRIQASPMEGTGVTPEAASGLAAVPAKLSQDCPSKCDVNISSGYVHMPGNAQSRRIQRNPLLENQVNT